MPSAKGMQWVSGRYDLHGLGRVNKYEHRPATRMMRDSGFVSFQGRGPLYKVLFLMTSWPGNDWRQLSSDKRVGLKMSVLHLRVFLQSFVWSDVIQYVSTFAIVGKLVQALGRTLPQKI